MFLPILFWWKFLLFVWHRFLFREFLVEELFSNRFWQTCFQNIFGRDSSFQSSGRECLFTDSLVDNS